MHAEKLTLLLGGRWYGHYGAARCPAHDDRHPSLSIKDGDVGNLLLYWHAGCEYSAIKTALAHCHREFSGLQNVPRAHRPSLTRVPAALLNRILSEAQPVRGTAAERYLRHRGIRGPITSSLCYHPTLRHPRAGAYPALISPVVRRHDVSGLHRTYLRADGLGKAAVNPAKALLGSCRGGAVRLREGSRGLVVCEGIETGLSLCDALPGDLAVWAALSTSGMRGLELPRYDRFRGKLVIAADGDQPGLKAGYALADVAISWGWSVEIMSPPLGKDFNDLAQECPDG